MGGESGDVLVVEMIGLLDARLALSRAKREGSCSTLFSTVVLWFRGSIELMVVGLRVPTRAFEFLGEGGGHER